MNSYEINTPSSKLVTSRTTDVPDLNVEDRRSVKYQFLFLEKRSERHNVLSSCVNGRSGISVDEHGQSMLKSYFVEPIQAQPEETRVKGLYTTQTQEAALP